MKQTIRLTESELRGMINKAVNEAMAHRNNKKKTVKLSETQLRGMINAAVNEALSEMTYDDYEKAKEQHPGLMNKVDPRTFASRARGVNAQGRQRNDDPMAMKAGAVSAWNDRYEQHNTDYDNNTWGYRYMNNDGNYTVHDNNGSYDVNDGNGRSTMGRQYNPKDNTLNYQYNQYDKYGKNIPQKQKSGTTQNAAGSDEGRNVARQMATGQGQYNPNTGWQ